MNLDGLKTKKLIFALAGVIATAVNSALGNPIEEKAMYSIVGILVAYLMAQGVADHGAQGAAKAVERAVAKGAEVSAAVQGVLGGNPVEVVVPDDDDPTWDATTEVDEEDGPKELNG